MAVYRLRFNQSLKGCTNAELLKKLKALHTELREIDQDNIQVESLNKVAKECISPTLLLHKEKGVKAYLACCLADILKLYAPSAPYTEHELKDLFQFLFRQLKHLTTAQEPHFSEYFYVIDSLSNVKSIVLICDLECADELMEIIFKQSFDLISAETPKNVELAMADILVQLVEEPQTLHSDVVDTLLAQFLPKNVKQKGAAYRLAVDVCSAQSDKLQRYVCQYFSDTITSNIADPVNLSDDEGATTNSKGMATLPPAFVTAHALIKQLNRSVPSLLLNVIPQLEEELSAERPEYRKLATETLGAMIGEKIGAGDLARKYPSTWKAWLGRSKDKVVAVRIAMVESLKKIWTEHPELGAEIENTFMKSLGDADEKVRVAACKVFLELDYETACHHVSTQILKELGSRCEDKKASVREIAFESLGRLYNLAFSEIESRDQDAIAHFGWIPSTILQTLIVDASLQNLIRVEVEHVLFTHLLPLPKKDDEDVQWVDRFLVVMQHLNDLNVHSLFTLTSWTDRRSPFEFFVEACEKYNSGIMDSDEQKIKDALKGVIRAIAGGLPDAAKATEDMNKFAKANEKQVYKLLRTLMDPQSDLKTIIKANKECLRRIDQISPTIVDTFRTIIRRSSNFLINRSSISPLLKRLTIQSGPEGGTLAQLSAIVLQRIAKSKPTLYKSHLVELTRTLVDGADDKVLDVTLHVLSRVVKVDPSIHPDKKLAERAQHFARTGTLKQAKYAATIVALDSARPGSADDLVGFIVDRLEAGVSSAEVVSHLAALTRLARHAQAAFEGKSEEITAFLLTSVLLKEVVDTNEDMNESTLWGEESQIDDDVQARLLSIKILTNRCMADAGSTTAVEIAKPVFKLLLSLLKSKDSESDRISAVNARLRLAASLALLKLATAGQTYQAQIATHFATLAWTAQDIDFDVRQRFILKLIVYLRANKIVVPNKFIVILFLVAHDPESDIKANARSFVIKRFKATPPAQRAILFEQPFVRLLHLLAHHPDFVHGDDEEEIKVMAKYIELYLDCIATSENIPFLYHLALKVKTVRDRQDDESTNRKLYVLSELAQHLMNARKASHGWSIPTYPGSVLMSADLFKPLANATEAKRVSDESYLSTETLEALTAATKAAHQGMKKPRATTTTTVKKSVPKPRKRKSPTTKTTTKAKKRARKSVEPKWDEDDDEDEEEDELDSDSDEDREEDDEVMKKKPVVVGTSKSTRTGLRTRGGAGKGKGKGKVEEEVESEDEEQSEEEEKMKKKSSRSKKGKKVSDEEDEEEDSDEAME